MAKASKKRYINFRAVALSLIFLFNPNVNVIDVLPDFLGYILLCFALTNLGDINESVAEALKTFKRMIIVDAAKILAIFWIFGISVVSERNSSLMFWSFSFGVLEMVFLIPAFIKLFAGLTELGYLHDNTSVVSARKAGKRLSYTDRMSRFTVFFVVLKATLSFLPELSDLTSTEYYENAGMTNLYQHIGIMRFLAFIPVLIVGIIWIIKCYLYFRRIDADDVFVTALDGVYLRDVAPKQGIFVKRNFSTAFVTLIIALIFSFDFRFENYNMLPDTVCAVLLLVFFLIISKRVRINKALCYSLCGAYIAVSALAYFTEYRFFDKYYYGAILRSEDAMLAFVLTVVASFVSCALFVAVTVVALRVISRVIDEHTGAILSLNSEHEQSRLRINSAIRAELRKYVWIALAGTIVFVASELAYVLLAKDFGFMLLINSVGALIMIVSFVKLYLEVSEAIESRYCLE